MIDFEQIVTQILWENWEGDLIFLTETTVVNIIEDHVWPRKIETAMTNVAALASPTSVSIPENMANAYSAVPHNVPEKTTLEAAVAKLKQNVRGTGFKANSFIGIATWFPVLDLIALFVAASAKDPPTWANATDENSIGRAASQVIYQAWEQQLKNYHGAAPVLYQPLSPTCKIIQRDLLNKTNIGVLRFADLVQKSPKSSLFALAKTLFEIRKQAKFTFLPKSLVQKFNLEGDKILSDIIYHPWEVVRGSYSINKDLQEIYEHGIINMLVDLSLSFHRLYIAELNNITGYVTMYPDTTPTLTADLETLKKLPVAIANDQTYYTQFIGSENPQEAILIDYGNWIRDALGVNIPLTAGTLPETIDFKSDNNIKNLTYVYNAENLNDAAKGDNAAAAGVVQEFEEVANYITTYEPAGDKLGAATGIAKGLMFGVASS